MDLKAIDAEIKQLHLLKTLTKIYGEVAAVRMAKVREKVLFSRQFLEELRGVFEDARTAYVAQVKALGRQKGKVTLLSHNGMKVAVLLSANTRLYGDLVKRTFDMFLEDVKVGHAEATIIGKVGLNMFEQIMPDKPKTYFEFPDTEMDRDKLKAMVKHLVQYEELHVYYGKFKNVIRQDAEMLTITAQIDLTDKGKPQRSYLFEPTLEEVLRYFETEIFGSQLEQAVEESQLAKYAARLTAMDRAEQNIGERIETTKLQRLMAYHRLANRKQVNSMSSILARFR